MKFQGLHKWLALAALALAVAVASPAAYAAEDCPAPSGDPIAIGFNVALSGPVAGWGLPGKTGLQMWVDEQTEEDRAHLRSAATGLSLEVPIRSKQWTGTKAPFGPRAAYEVLYALGRLLNERFPD